MVKLTLWFNYSIDIPIPIFIYVCVMKLCICVFMLMILSYCKCCIYTLPFNSKSTTRHYVKIFVTWINIKFSQKFHFNPTPSHPHNARGPDGHKWTDIEGPGRIGIKNLQPADFFFKILSFFYVATIFWLLIFKKNCRNTIFKNIDKDISMLTILVFQITFTCYKILKVV